MQQRPEEFQIIEWAKRTATSLSAIDAIAIDPPYHMAQFVRILG